MNFLKMFRQGGKFLAQPKRVFKIAFWIGIAFNVLPAFVHCFYAEYPIATIFVSIIYGIVWGLMLGGLAVLGMKIYNKLQSKDNPSDDS